MAKFAELFQKRPDSLPGAIKPGLQRMRKAYDHLGRPGCDIPTVLVGGTNGKGSTAVSLWQMLSLGGARPALYTSPHLVHFSERFTIAGTSIDDERIFQIHSELKSRLGSLYRDMSFFEVATLIALLLFVEERATHLVLEVGLGGRWDATNVVEPQLSIIASIGLDHQAYLGSDLASIAAEKAGIMRAGKPILWAGAAGGAPLADHEIRRQARERGALLQVLGEDFSELILADDAPPFLVANRSLAHRACLQWLGAAAWPVIAQRWSERLVPPSLRGRFQFVSQGYRGRDVLVDVCHNREGAQAFAKAFAKAYPGHRPTVFVTCSRDKDHHAIALALLETFSRLIFFPTKAERSWTPASTNDLPPGTEWSDDLSQAVDDHAEQSLVVICGSVLGIGNLVECGKLLLP